VGQVIDTCVWIDHLREQTPVATRKLADEKLNEKDALLCEPVRFELFSGASRHSRPQLQRRLETMPLLPTPTQLWSDATNLGLKVTDSGLRIPAVDLLIAAICLHHQVALTTFDTHFIPIAELTKLRLNLLVRPA
jgi:predicted nucleic acid-binding protein